MGLQIITHNDFTVSRLSQMKTVALFVALNLGCPTQNIDSSQAEILLLADHDTKV